MKKNLYPLLLCLGTLALSGCESDTLPSQQTVDNSTAYARFNPVDGTIPFPNNLLFNGSTDGTLNIPVADPNDYSDPQVAMNALDGFSTIAPLTAQTSVALDPASVTAGETVRVFEVTLTGIGGAVTAITRELTPNLEYVASLSSIDATTLVITPLVPLTGSTSYLVTLNDGLTTASGSPLNAEFYYALLKGDSPLHIGGVSQYHGLSDADAQSLEPLRQLTTAAETTVENYTITNDAGNAITDQARSGIVLSWSFTTQSIGASLSTLAGGVAPVTPATVATGMTTGAVGGLGAADIHAGTLNVPYYLDAAAPLSGFWHGAGGSLITGYNPQPVATGTQTIPLLMTLPNASSGQPQPAGGWPVVIFQHGITQDRSNLLAVADALAYAGYAAVAIDLPLHGITDTTNPLYTATIERTFNLDLVDANGQPVPDGVIDPSGTHFINLRSLLTTRDNVRQAVADLLTLRASLGSIAGIGINPNNVSFVGHSLGAMVGTPFLATDTLVGTAVLGMPGAGIAKLLDGSAEFGPRLAAGLAANGVIKGSADYEAFMMAAQTVIDTIDPLNHTASAVLNRGTLLFEVVGGVGTLPDQVVPNNVMADAPAGTIPSPTAGTDPLARVMGLTRYDQSQAAPGLKAWVRFNAGHHGSLLLPMDAAGNADPLSAQVFFEMQGEMAAFIASGGAVLSITDTTVVEPVAAP